jgi:hypothetical protein
MSRTGHAAYAPNAVNGLRATLPVERLNAFIAERERRARHRGGAEDVIAFVNTLARNEGPESVCELLDLAAKFGDFDIVDYEVYKELVTTSSYT